MANTIADFKAGDFIRLKFNKAFGPTSIVLLSAELVDQNDQPGGDLIQCAIRYKEMGSFWIPARIPFDRVQGIWGNATNDSRAVFPKKRATEKSILVRIKDKAAHMPFQSGKLVMPLSRKMWTKLGSEMGLVLRADKTLEIPLASGRTVELFLLP